MTQNKSVEKVVERWEAQGHISPQHSKEVIFQDLTKLLQTSQEREREIWIGICNMCDSNNPSHEHIWRVAYGELQNLTNPNKD